MSFREQEQKRFDEEFVREDGLLDISKYDEEYVKSFNSQSFLRLLELIEARLPKEESEGYSDDYGVTRNDKGIGFNTCLSQVKALLATIREEVK